MDARRINEILEELVIWELPDRVDDRINIRDREETKRHLFRLGYSEDEIDEALDEIVHDSRMVVDGVNITIPKKIKAIKHEPKLCELGCGQMVIDQKIEKRYSDYPIKHWKTKCSNCQYYLHPEGHLVRGTNEITAYFAKKIKQENK